MIIVVTLLCCGPDRRHRAHGGVGTVPVERWLPNILDAALMLSLQSTRHVRTASHASSVALPLPLTTLVDLPQKHRDAQPFARGLAWQELVLALRQMSALAVMLRMGVGEEARAQEHGMLPVFLAQRVHTLI